MSITFFVPGIPVAKARSRAGRTRDGRPVQYTPPATKSYEARVAWAGKAARDAEGASEPFSGPIRLTLCVTIACPKSWSQRRQTQAHGAAIAATKRPDLDNYVKAIKDGLNGIVWQDDSQVVELVARKRYGPEPGVRVMISETNQECAP